MGIGHVDIRVGIMNSLECVYIGGIMNSLECPTYLDIRVGIMNSLECVCFPLHEHLGGE